MKITVDMLRSHFACDDQLEAFIREFPEGTPETMGAALAAAERVDRIFDWYWAAEKLLSPAARDAYLRAAGSARATCIRAREAARTAHGRALTGISDTFVRATTEIRWAEYQRALDAAWADYRRAKAVAEANYRRAHARAFVKAWFGVPQ